MDAVKMKGFTRLTRIDDAMEKFFSRVDIEELPAEEIPTLEALGRVLAEDVVARADVPSFDRAAVDGYALRAEDTYGASSTNPIVLNIVGTVEIGILSEITVRRQEAVRIATGAPVPAGADAVMMVEYTEKIGEDRVEICNQVTPGENVSRKGEDVKRGERILAKGTLIQPQDVGILAALGNSAVKTVKRPRIAVLSTGNELVELGEKAEQGRIIDTNRPILIAMIRNLGGEPIDLGIVKDDLEEIKSRIAYGMSVSDMIVASGGTSVGAGDLLPEAINGLGKPGVIVHGLCMRPGRPTALAAIGGKPVILLPGFPVAAMISFSVIVQPILVEMLGASADQFAGRVVRARMLRRTPSSLGNRTFVRMIVKEVGGEYFAEPLRTSGSGVISSMIRANGMVVIPEDKEGLEEGEEVEVELLRPVGG